MTEVTGRFELSGTQVPQPNGHLVVDAGTGSSRNSDVFNGVALTGESSCTRDLPARRVESIRSGIGKLNVAVIERVIEVLESVRVDRPLDLEIQIESLCGLVAELWAQAKDASQYHRLILAAVNSAMIQSSQASTMTERQLAALRSAMFDLSSRILTQSNVDSVMSYLIDEGFTPFAGLSGYDREDSAGYVDP